MNTNTNVFKWIISIIITLILVGGTILHICYAYKVNRLVNGIMNKQTDDYAWEVHPDGTMVSYPSMTKTKTDIYVTVDGRKYAITPQGDTLYFKNR